MLSVDKDVLGVLRRLGLNQYESKTYLALTTAASSTATELSDVANIPRPRVYDVLAKLEKKGFVITKPGRPTRYSAVSASTAIEALKRERRDQHNKEIDELEKLEDKLAAAVQVSEMEQPTGEEVFVMKDRKNIYATLADLISNADKSILIASHKEGLQRKRDEYGALLHKAQKRGVDVQLIEHPNRISLIDDHAILFLNDANEPKNERAAWIKSSYITKGLREIF